MSGSSAGARELAVKLSARLREAGHQAYLVGGCVRDLLLEREPKDYDIATDARPDRILELFPGAEQVGTHFGVIRVQEGTAEVEVATFRSDRFYRDGRHPERVEFETEPRRDVLRRDFTINALLLDLERNRVLDFVGGREDLERRLIRSVGDPGERFREDHLRMLRAVRFAARLKFDIEGATFEAIRSLAPLIRRVSAERIRDEILRILTEGGARRGFELLDESGLLGEILPEVAAMKGIEQPPEFHPEGDVWRHTLLMLGAMREPTAALALGVLLHDVGKPATFSPASAGDRIRFNDHAQVGARMAVEILERLRCPNELIRQVRALVAHHLRFIEVRRMREATLKRFLRLERFEEHLELHRLDCLASHGDLSNYEFVKEKLETLPPETLRPARLLTGHDLVREGYLPGPAFARMLEEVETAQLESRIKTRDEALALVRSLFAPPDGSLKSAGR